MLVFHASMQVISYSLWGDADRYVLPLIKNLEIGKRLFKEWKIVVYLASSTKPSIKEILVSQGAAIYECGESPDTRGAFWRFRALSLPDVDTVIIRDADSPLTKRDRALVDYWLASDKEFYLCRDHPQHVRPLVAGLWGCRGKGIEKIKKIASFDPGYARYGDDEKYLAQTVYLKHQREFMVFSPYLSYRGEHPESLRLSRTNYADYLGRVESEENEWSDQVMKAVWDQKTVKRKYRWLVPYAWSWKIIHWFSLHILRKKGVQEWRDFSKETRGLFKRNG